MRISLRESWNTFTVLGEIAFMNDVEWCYSLYREILVDLSKTWKNIKRNYTSLSKFLSSKSTCTYNDFNHRNFDRISEPLKFRRYLYFRQVVRSANCPFGKISVRQNVRSAKRPFGKTSVGKMSIRSAKCLSAKCLSAKCPGTEHARLLYICWHLWFGFTAENLRIYKVLCWLKMQNFKFTFHKNKLYQLERSQQSIN
jgi:hypothetical protein